MNWYENLPKSEIPPEYLWEDVDGLEMWWNTVNERRDEKYSGGNYRQSGGGDEPEQEMADNDLARFLKES